MSVCSPPFRVKKKPTGYAGGCGGQGKGFSSSKRQYTKKLRCAKLNVRLATVHKGKHTGGRFDEKSRKRHIQFSTHDVEMSIIVFAPKYCKQIIYGKYKAAIGKILQRICERCDGVEIIEANACEDHIHIRKQIKTVIKRWLLKIVAIVRSFECE